RATAWQLRRGRRTRTYLSRRRNRTRSVAEIRLDHLTKLFPGGVRAVDDLQLTVPHGSFTALLGPSGCGKTTTMNMISGLERPTSGEIYFDDRPVSRVPPGRR